MTKVGSKTNNQIWFLAKQMYFCTITYKRQQHVRGIYQIRKDAGRKGSGTYFAKGKNNPKATI